MAAQRPVLEAYGNVARGCREDGIRRRLEHRVGHVEETLMTRRSVPMVLISVVALIGSACGGQQSPASSSPGGGSAPAGSPSAASISGSLEIGARYGCQPAPCTPDPEGEG